jgi:hypothetical protein
MAPPTDERRPLDRSAADEMTNGVAPSKPRPADSPRHRLCRSHVKRHFCTAEIWRRRKISAELTRLCGGGR